MDGMIDEARRPRRQPWKRLLRNILPSAAAWPVLLTVMAAVFVLTGRVYRIGYLAYLHLEPSLFPDELSARVTYAAIAWSNVFGLFSQATSGFWTGHVVLGILAPTLALIAFAVFLALLRTLTHAARRHASETSPPDWLRRAGRGVGRGLLCALRWLFPSERAWIPIDWARKVMMGGLTIFMALLILGAVLNLLLLAFQLAGEHSAARDVAKGFRASAVVRIREGNEDLSYRLIECGPAHCALFSDHRAVVIPLSEMKRAESAIP